MTGGSDILKAVLKKKKKSYQVHWTYFHTQLWNKKKHLLARTTNRTEVAEYWKIKNFCH